MVTGYSVFLSLPESFFDDPEAFGKKPIGNGSFQAETELAEESGITLTRYDDFSGTEPAKVDLLECRIVGSVDTAYRNVQGGEVDVSMVPVAALTTAAAEFGDRFVSLSAPSFHYLGFPMCDERFSDKRVRQAFSMANDRDQITDVLFQGSRLPARSMVPPMIPGDRADACPYCVYDPERAKQLLTDAGFDTSVPVEIWYNPTSGHDDWVPAVANQ